MTPDIARETLTLNPCQSECPLDEADPGCPLPVKRLF